MDGKNQRWLPECSQQSYYSVAVSSKQNQRSLIRAVRPQNNNVPTPINLRYKVIRLLPVLLSSSLYMSLKCKDYSAACKQNMSRYKQQIPQIAIRFLKTMLSLPKTV